MRCGPGPGQAGWGFGAGPGSAGSGPTIGGGVSRVSCLRRQVAEERLEPLGVDRLLGDELLREGVQLVAVGDQDVHRPLVGVVDDRPDLLVDLLGDLVGVVPLLADLAAEEHELVALAEATAGRGDRSSRTR